MNNPKWYNLIRAQKVQTSFQCSRPGLYWTAPEMVSLNPIQFRVPVNEDHDCCSRLFPSYIQKNVDLISSISAISRVEYCEISSPAGGSKK